MSFDFDDDEKESSDVLTHCEVCGGKLKSYRDDHVAKKCWCDDFIEEPSEPIGDFE